LVLLAKEIASRNDLSLSTSDKNSWIASAFNYGTGKHNSDQNDRQTSGQQDSNEVSYLLLKDILPKNLLDIRPDRLLRFREQRKDERRQFHQALDEFAAKLERAEDPVARKAIWEDERRYLESAITDYRKGMDILGVSEFMGITARILEISSLAMNDSLSRFGLASGGIVLGAIATGIKNRQREKNNPYSYLNSISEITPSDLIL
jgi:hypothetical protein